MAIRTAVISDAKAGSPSTVDLTQYISNPFAAEGNPVTIVGSPSASLPGTMISVSGLSMTVETESLAEGGQNLYTQQLPRSVSHGNLVLERGMVVGSPLNIEFNASLSTFKFITSNVLVTLLSEDGLPMAAWLFMKAWPVKWSTSDLDATTPGLVIDTMELAYARMQVLRV